MLTVQLYEVWTFFERLEASAVEKIDLILRQTKLLNKDQL
jgi:hypothetical protein